MREQGAALASQRADAALARAVAERDAAAKARLAHVPAAQRQRAERVQAELAAAQDALAATHGRCSTLKAEGHAAHKEAARLRKVLDCSVLERQVAVAEKVVEESEAAVEEAKVCAPLSVWP